MSTTKHLSRVTKLKIRKLSTSLVKKILQEKYPHISTDELIYIKSRARIGNKKLKSKLKGLICTIHKKKIETLDSITFLNINHNYEPCKLCSVEKKKLTFINSSVNKLKKDLPEIKKKLPNLIFDNFKYKIKNKENKTSKIYNLKCRIHKEEKIFSTYQRLKSGQQPCKECFKTKRYKNIKGVRFRTKIEDLTLSQKNYNLAESSIVIIKRNSYLKNIKCNLHKKYFSQRLWVSQNGKQGCVDCRSESARMSAQEKIIQYLKKYKIPLILNKFSGYLADKNSEWKCKNCGVISKKIFGQIKQGYYCLHCARILIAQKKRTSKKEAYELLVLNGRSDIKMIYYSGATMQKSTFGCTKNKLHPTWDTSLAKILHKQTGCPTCKDSKANREISFFLIKNKINFIREKKFDNLIGEKRKLKYDFYCPKLNLLIEFDGQHHSEIVNFGGISNDKARENYLITKKYDELKNEYAKKEGIKILRIKFNQNPTNTLKKYLSKTV